VANGSGLLSKVDGRTLWVRRFKEILADHLSDIPEATVGERSIIRRASTLEVELEKMEVAFASTNSATPADIDLYARCAANLRRLLESVGLKRRSKDVTPSLCEYLSAPAGKQTNND
jgi:hypothetical protein